MLDTHATMGIKMKLEVITSVNQDYYDRIGRDCFRSYLAHWSTTLTVYAESVAIDQHPRVRVIDFDQLGDDYREFQNNTNLSRRCRTFAKKAFSVLHALDHSQADWIIWLDADVITQQSDPAAVLAQILPPNDLAMYMGVTYTDHAGTGKQGYWLVPETGLFGINLTHASMPDLRKEYRRRYVERDFADLRRSYDNDVFGAAIRNTPADYLDLCADLAKPYKTPLKHTVLGEYLHHHKAKHRKIDYAEAQ